MQSLQSFSSLKLLPTVVKVNFVSIKTGVKQVPTPPTFKLKFQAKDHTKHVRAAEIQSSSSSSDSENAKTQTNYTATVLGFVAGAFGLAWIASVLFPKIVMQYMFNMSIFPESKTTFIGFVAYFPVMAACLTSMQSAVLNDRLGSDTYRRINLGLVAISIGIIVNCLMLGMWDLVGVNILRAAHVIIFLIAGYGYYQHPFFDMGSQLRGFFSSLIKRQSLNSFIYEIIIFASIFGFYILGLNAQSYIFEGLSTSMEVFMKRSVGIACLLYIMICATLKDAANRDRLGASTFKNLNIGMCLMALSTCLSFGWAYIEGASIKFSPFMSQEISTALATIFFFSQIFAKKKK